MQFGHEISRLLYTETSARSQRRDSVLGNLVGDIRVPHRVVSTGMNAPVIRALRTAYAFR